jgi:NADPH:quinone reductase-like Zn-dependent oxidoreductase
VPQRRVLTSRTPCGALLSSPLHGVGGTALEEAAELLKDRSKLISGADRNAVAALGGAPVARKRTADVLDAVARLALDGTLNPQVTDTYPLDQADHALGFFRTRNAPVARLSPSALP